VRSLRLGVVLFDITRLASDWITPHVLAGIDEAAGDAGVKVELYGGSDSNIDAISRRIERERPEVLVSLAVRPQDALLLRDCVRLGIPSLVMGTAHQYLGLPSVVEDNVGAAEVATQTLIDHGHERIGMVLNRWPAPWVFERQEGFERTIIQAGLDLDEPGVCWIGASNHPGYTQASTSHRSLSTNLSGLMEPGSPFVGAVERVEAWMRRHRPTALVAGSYIGARIATLAAKRIGLSIPGDLSFITFDPHPALSQWVGMERPSMVRLPLHDMGRRIATVSRSLAEGVHPDRIGCVRVPFVTDPGDSIVPPTALRRGGSSFYEPATSAGEVSTSTGGNS
jgi:LacI family transcriptional regulator